MVTVLLIDDDRAMRMELSSLLLHHSCAIRWLGHGADLSELQHVAVDVMVVNLASAHGEQQHCIERLFDRIVCARAIVIVDDIASAGPRHAMDRGAYVLRSHAAMLEQLARLIIGRPAPETGVGGRLPRDSSTLRAWRAGGLAVNARELQIIEGVKNGHTNQRIAAELGTSEQQVKNILSRLYKRHRIKNRVSLINMVRSHEAEMAVEGPAVHTRA